MYFVTGEADEYPIKIGRSKLWAIDSRLRSIQTHMPYRLQVLGLVCGWSSLEAELHDSFSESRLRGEWFERSPDLLEMIGAINRIKPRWREEYADYLDERGFIPKGSLRRGVSLDG